jgi:DNA primase
MRELQMWCPAPLPEGELHRRKLRSDKYKPPAGRQLEFYESNSSVEADEDTDAETGADQDAGVVKSRRRTRSTVVKKSASVVAAAISAVKAAEQKKKKRKAASPPAVITPSVPTLRSWEVKSEEEEEKEKDEAVEELPVPMDQAARRPESPAAKRQRELVQKTSEDALRRGLEAQRSAAAAHVRMPTTIKPRVFWLKTRLPAVMR